MEREKDRAEDNCLIFIPSPALPDCCQEQVKGLTRDMVLILQRYRAKESTTVPDVTILGGIALSIFFEMLMTHTNKHDELEPKNICRYVDIVSHALQQATREVGGVGSEVLQ